MAMILRWVCEKCNKRWIYPIEKCVYCKGSISKQKGTDLKVIGFTKVNIPSPMHPIIPYHIVLLEDEHGNKMPRKIMKEYKIGDKFFDELAKTDDAVSIIRVKYDVYEAIKDSISLLKDFKVSSEDKILIKPSCITAAYPYQAINTSPEFLDALFKVLYDLGIKKEHIIVGEQALIGSDSIDAAAKSGLLEVCKKHGITFVDLSKGPFEMIEADGATFNIHKEALSRKIINAPIMKTNFQITISGAMENLSRLCDQETQRKIYQNGVDLTLPKLSRKLNVFTVADATNALMGQGPLATGEPAFLNLVLSSKNAAALDASFCEITMLPIPKYVDFDSRKLEVVGNSIDALKFELKGANEHESPHPDIRLIDGDACPACLNLMNNLTTKLIGVRGDPITIAMGSRLNVTELNGIDRLILLGDCAIKSVGDEVHAARMEENVDFIEQLILMQKLFTTKGTPRITTVDKVKSKMKKLFSKVVR